MQQLLFGGWKIMKDGFLCICCRRRKGNNEAHIREEYIGICSHCQDRLSNLPKGAVFAGDEYVSSVFSVFGYKGIIRNAIKRYKFGGQWRYSKIFVMIMYDYLKDLGLAKDFDFMTMIPLSRKRLWERGYNQTELLAKPLAELLEIPFLANTVHKKKNTRPQSASRGRVARFLNVKGVYIADRKRVKGKNILLVDDVYTSGATMKSCAKELIEAGAENIVGITLARVLKKDV